MNDITWAGVLFSQLFLHKLSACYPVRDIFCINSSIWSILVNNSLDALPQVICVTLVGMIISSWSLGKKESRVYDEGQIWL